MIKYLQRTGKSLMLFEVCLLVTGILMGIGYWFAMTKLNLKTPGKKEDDISDEEIHITLENDDFTEFAQAVLAGIGGKENVKSIDHCITRLRLEIKEHTLVDEEKIKASGARGVMRPSKTNVQVIIGVQVQFIADELKKLCK